ncbi:glycosyltransferase family 2 protein [Rhizobium phaseoli]|uniref:glycosyltransferase family 2 protein n=1 Tax=Rhizobium phaseoli TaxID=396 RepID=UPI003D6DE0B6
MLSCTDKDRGDTFNPRQPLVSVVIPAFNASAYVERTLQSAMRQTYTALEIIVVNDGSTDDTAEIVEQIAMSDSRIRLLSTPNRGVGKSFDVRWLQIPTSLNTRSEVQWMPLINMRFGNSGRLGEVIFHS